MSDVSGSPFRPVLTAVIQAGATETGGPPIGGIAAQLMFWAFLFVMIGVPAVMARDAARALRRADEVRAPSGRRGAAEEPTMFSSARERGLWLWVLVVMAAIYATLSPMQQLAAELRARGLLGLSSTVAVLLVVGVVATRWARTRPGHLELGAALGVVAVYLTTVIRLPVPEARSHLFEYGLVAMLVYHALLERRGHGRRVPVPAVLAVVVTALLGWLDEGIQLVLPNRSYDLVDVGFNALAATMAVTSSLFMGWARRFDVVRRVTRG